MKRDDAKLRLLLVERMLRNDRIISTKEILRRLESRGIIADRKTIYDDIKAINLIVPVKSFAGKRGGFMIWDVMGGCDNECEKGTAG